MKQQTTKMMSIQRINLTEIAITAADCEVAQVLIAVKDINTLLNKKSLLVELNIFLHTVVLIRDQTRSVAKQVSVAVGWVKIKISLMAQLKGLTAKFKLM